MLGVASSSFMMPQATLLRYFAGSVARADPPLPAGPRETRMEVMPKVAQIRHSADPSLRQRRGVCSDAPAPRPDPVTQSSEPDPHPITQALANSPVVQAPRIAIAPVESSHLPALKRLTSTLLPIRYPESFFAEAVDDPLPATFSRVAIFSSKPVGWIRCCLDPFPEPTSPPSPATPIYNQIYIQALCLLAPYRGQGVAIALLENILSPGTLTEHNIESIYAHVWEKNDGALSWYEKRGFRRTMMVENYYRKLRPGGAWIVRKDIG